MLQDLFKSGQVPDAIIDVYVATMVVALVLPQTPLGEAANNAAYITSRICNAFNHDIRPYGELVTQLYAEYEREIESVRAQLVKQLADESDE